MLPTEVHSHVYFQLWNEGGLFLSVSSEMCCLHVTHASSLLDWNPCRIFSLADLNFYVLVSYECGFLHWFILQMLMAKSVCLDCVQFFFKLLFSCFKKKKKSCCFRWKCMLKQWPNSEDDNHGFKCFSASRLHSQKNGPRRLEDKGLQLLLPDIIA